MSPEHAQVVEAQTPRQRQGRLARGLHLVAERACRPRTTAKTTLQVLLVEHFLS